MSNNNTKTIIGIIIVFVIGFFVYNLSSENNKLSPIESNEVGDLELIDNDIITTLRRVQDITLDSSIFSNPVFNSLQDFSREIVDEPIGKENPFSNIKTNNENKDNTYEKVPENN